MVPLWAPQAVGQLTDYTSLQQCSLQQHLWRRAWKNMNFLLAILQYSARLMAEVRP